MQYKPWEQDVIDLRAEGMSWTDTADEIRRRYPDMSDTGEMKLIRSCRSVLEKHERNKKNSLTAVEPAAVSKKYNQDGTVESVCLIELWDGEDLTPEKILAFHKLDPEKWQVISYTNNIWHAMTGKEQGNQRRQMYQSKLVAKPKAGGLSYSDIDNYFQNKQYSKPSVIPLQYDASGEMLEVCVPDLHIGLLSWVQETGADYDIKIAREKFNVCMSDIIMRCKGRRFKRIYFVTLGDILHVDNDNQTTTKGTFQQVDGRTPKMFDIALDMLIDAIDLLLTVAPVEVVYLSGNHDRAMGYALIKAISCAYRQQNGITFDLKPNPQKHLLYGVNLIGWTHGDMSKKNMGNWLQDRAREDYGKAKYVEVHAGHLHTEGVEERYVGRTVVDTQTHDVGGIVIRHLPTISNSSFYIHQSGYPQGTKTMMCFIWHESMGLRGMWYSNL